jgi:hypothetical protein
MAPEPRRPQLRRQQGCCCIPLLSCCFDQHLPQPCLAPGRRERLPVVQLAVRALSSCFGSDANPASTLCYARCRLAGWQGVSGPGCAAAAANRQPVRRSPPAARTRNHTAAGSCKRSAMNADSGCSRQRPPHVAQDFLCQSEGCQMVTAASPFKLQHLAAGTSALPTITTRPQRLLARRQCCTLGHPLRRCLPCEPRLVDVSILTSQEGSAARWFDCWLAGDGLLQGLRAVAVCPPPGFDSCDCLPVVTMLWFFGFCSLCIT